MREAPPASAIVLALPGQGGFEDEAAMSLYLVCWKSDRAPWDTWSRLGQSEKRKHRPGKVIFSRQMKCVGPARAKESVGCGFSLRSVAFILWSVNPWGSVGCFEEA